MLQHLSPQGTTRLRRAVLIAGLISLALGSFNPAIARAQSSNPETVTHDGLELVKSRKIDALYRRPGASLASYSKIMLDPVEVEFKKTWKPREVSASDRERMRKDIADLCRKVFAKELQEKGGYAIVDAAGPEVLRVTPALVNIYVNAPDTMQPGRSRTYTTSAGEMTIVVELRDSESREVLARAADRKVADSSMRMQWTNRITNTAEAERAMRSWAQVLRDAMDAARGKEG